MQLTINRQKKNAPPNKQTNKHKHAPTTVQRGEQEVAEWRRRAEVGAHQAKEAAAESERAMEVFENKNNAHWTLQLETKEVSWLVG